MMKRALAAGAAMTLLAAPAWADCAEEIQALDEAMVAEETGATTEGMPATKHQEEVLADDATEGATEGGSAAAEADMPATKHQEQVLSGDAGEPAETAAGPTGDVETTSPHQQQAVRGVDEEQQSEAGTLLEEARALELAGQEEACMAKVTEAKAAMGAE